MRIFSIRASFALALVSVLAGSCHNSSRSNPTAPIKTKLTVTMDEASCKDSRTRIAIDEIDGVDVTFHISGINLTLAQPSSTVSLQAPAQYHVVFNGYDSSGHFTERWDFLTSLVSGTDKTELLHCVSALIPAESGAGSNPGRQR